MEYELEIDGEVFLVLKERPKPSEVIRFVASSIEHQPERWKQEDFWDGLRSVPGYNPEDSSVNPMDILNTMEENACRTGFCQAGFAMLSIPLQHVKVTSEKIEYEDFFFDGAQDLMDLEAELASYLFIGTYPSKWSIPAVSQMCDDQKRFFVTEVLHGLADTWEARNPLWDSGKPHVTDSLVIEDFHNVRDKVLEGMGLPCYEVVRLR